MTSFFHWSILIALLICRTGLSNPPEITSTSPLAVKPGQTTDVVFYGKYLDGATQAWTGFKSETKFVAPTVSTENKHLSASITVADDVAVGVYAARIATTQGVSQAIMMLVDDLPCIQEETQNHDRTTAQFIQAPMSVDGAGDGDKSDFFCFDASANEWFSIEVVSSRLGYSFDALLRVLDESGTEIESVDDTPGLSGDCRVRFQSPRKQRILIEVCDASYSSSARHKYRLRIGNFPIVRTLIPTPEEAGVINQRGSAMVRHSASSLPKLTSEVCVDNDCREKAMRIEGPVTMSGTFLAADNTFYFRLTLTAGSRRTVRGITRSLGSPADLLFKVYAPDGTLISTNDDAGLDDGLFELQAKIGGEYLLTVREINRQFGPDYSFQFEVTTSQDGFELSAKEERVNIGLGGVGLLSIVCKRTGFNGDILLRIDNPDSPFRLESNVIHETENEVLLKIIPVAELPLGSLEAIQITGRGERDGTEFKGRVSVLERIRTQFRSLPFPPEELWDNIAIAIAQPVPDFFNLRLASDEILFPRVVGEIYFTAFCVDRIDGFTDAIHVEALNLPKGVRTSGQDKPVGNSKNNEYRFEIRGPADSPIGDHNVSVRATGEFRGQAKEVLIKDVRFHVVNPLKVSLEFSKRDSKPDEIAVRVNAKRFVSRGGGDRKEIRCRWIDRPEWVDCPDSFVIGVGKNDELVRMSVNPKNEENEKTVYKGKLMLVAETSIGGQVVQVESDPFELKFSVPDVTDKD